MPHFYITPNICFDVFPDDSANSGRLVPGGPGYCLATSISGALLNTGANSKVHFLGPLSRDEFGGKFKTILEGAGVDIALAPASDYPALRVEIRDLSFERRIISGVQT